MIHFELIDGLTMADIAFKASGATIEEMFLGGARAVMHILLENPQDIIPVQPVLFRVEEDSLEMAYFEFLQKLIYYKDADRLLLVVHEVQVKQEKGRYAAECRCAGEKINRDRHVFNTDIKAITMHGLEVGTAGGTWTATVVVDV